VYKEQQDRQVSLTVTNPFCCSIAIIHLRLGILLKYEPKNNHTEVYYYTIVMKNLQTLL